MHRSFGWLFPTAFALAVVLPLAPQGPQPGPAPGLSLDEQEAFLKNAPIVDRQMLTGGTTRTTRITLSDGKLSHEAHVQTVDIFKPVFRTKKFVEKNFRDSYKYNIAAYHVSKMLGLNMTPPCVYREFDGQPASVCWWVDNLQFDELKRREKKLEPPDPERWTRQLNLIRVFDQLIDNTDRNQGNLLIDTEWNLWMIDHTRAFRETHQLRKPENLRRVSTQMLGGMRKLNFERCNAELQPHLTEPEIRAMLVRRDLLLKFFENAVNEHGPNSVFTDLPRHTPHVTIP
jgi:hypothetical protein